MKRLIFRLSSLGDVILSQAVLEPRYNGETHWVVAREFEALLKGNPAITRLWVYDRKKTPGLRAWLGFLKTLSNEKFDSVIDVHSTLRTLIARLYFLWSSPKTSWKKMSKERFRRLGYITFKRFWPQSLRPRHLSEKVAKLAGGSGSEKPNLRWMLSLNEAAKTSNPVTGTDSVTGIRKIALVPGSAWPGKEWSVDHYIVWLKEWSKSDRDKGASTQSSESFRSPETSSQSSSEKRAFSAQNQTLFVVLGASKDTAAISLRDALVREKISFVDGIGKYSLLEVAQVLADVQLTVGSDTGLLHLSEAVGTPVITLFGPTRSDFGFGPSDPRSTPLDSPLWCSPCSKDGSLCFRVIHRYKCLDQITPAQVGASTKQILKKGFSSSMSTRNSLDGEVRHE